MPLAAPTISPVASDGVLRTSEEVTATAHVYDQGAGDATAMFWGCFNSVRSQQGSPNTPLPIPSAQVCDGTVEVWYTATDAVGNKSYSDVTSIGESGTSHQLPAPQLAPSGATPADGMDVTVTVKAAFNPDLHVVPGDTIKITVLLYEILPGQWHLIRSETHSHFVNADEIIDDTITLQNITPAPNANQAVDTFFHLEKTFNGVSPQPRRYQAFLSDRTKQYGSGWYPTTPKELPAPVFTDAQNDVLNLITLPAGQDVGLKIPSTSVITVTSVVQINGWGTDQDGKTIPAASWQSAPITSIMSTPYTGTPIPRDRVNAVPDQGHYFAQYTVDGTQDSPPAAVLVKNASGPTPGGEKGALWGWGSTDSGVLG